MRGENVAEQDQRQPAPLVRRDGLAGMALSWGERGPPRIPNVAERVHRRDNAVLAGAGQSQPGARTLPGWRNGRRSGLKIRR